MSVADFVRNLFSGTGTENLYNVALPSGGKPPAGWFMVLTQASTPLGVQWTCPGKTVYLSRPRTKDDPQTDAEGNKLTGEVRAPQFVACSYTSPVMPPDMEGYKNHSARCGSCGNTSKLSDFLRDMKIGLKDLPTTTKTHPVAQNRFIDPGGWNDGNSDGFGYERATCPWT